MCLLRGQECSRETFTTYKMCLNVKWKGILQLIGLKQTFQIGKLGFFFPKLAQKARLDRALTILIHLKMSLLTAVTVYNDLLYHISIIFCHYLCGFYVFLLASSTICS